MSNSNNKGNMKTQDRTIRDLIKKIEGLAVSNKGEIRLYKKLGEHMTEVGAYNTALSDVIDLLKQPEKQEIDKLELPKDMTEIKLNEVIEAVNKLSSMKGSK